MPKKKDKLIIKTKNLKIVRNIDFEECTATEMLDEFISVMFHMTFSEESIKKALNEVTV